MDWLVYGAYGYSGRLIVAEAVRRGLRPVLAGRNAAALRGLAEEYGLPHRVFDIADAATELAREPVGLLLNCAGPFAATVRPVLAACLEQRVHYLDITGEIEVFEFAHAQAGAARHADVVVCPGTGFDVVATDCLAASLVRELPAATTLVLAFDAAGGPSRGTARTMVRALGDGGRIRRDGVMRRVPLAWKTRRVDFAHASLATVTIPWGDVFTAWVSTGVANVEVYLAMPPGAIRRLRMARWLRPLLATGLVRRRLEARIDARPPGPDARRRSTTGVEVWGEASSADGRAIRGTLSGPNGYDFTAQAAVGIVEKVLGGGVEGGYYTPSLLMGAGYAAGLRGVRQVIPAPR